MSIHLAGLGGDEPSRTPKPAFATNAMLDDAL